LKILNVGYSIDALSIQHSNNDHFLYLPWFLG
jgi:hypothetical protein